MTKEEKEYQAKYRQENKDKLKAKNAAYRAKWYSENSEKVKARAKKYKAENSEKVKARAKKYKAENSEKVKVLAKKWYADNPEKIKEYIKRAACKKFNITPEKYQSLMEQKHCAICGKKEEESLSHAIDHNHKTNKVRERLCRKCNIFLGLAKENKHILLAAAKYLEKHE